MHINSCEVLSFASDVFHCVFLWIYESVTVVFCIVTIFGFLDGKMFAYMHTVIFICVCIIYKCDILSKRTHYFEQLVFLCRESVTKRQSVECDMYHQILLMKQVERYKVLYVYRRHYETGGMYWAQVWALCRKNARTVMQMHSLACVY